MNSSRGRPTLPKKLGAMMSLAVIVGAPASHQPVLLSRAWRSASASRCHAPSGRPRGLRVQPSPGSESTRHDPPDQDGLDPKPRLPLRSASPRPPVTHPAAAHTQGRPSPSHRSNVSCSLPAWPACTSARAMSGRVTALPSASARSRTASTSTGAPRSASSSTIFRARFSRSWRCSRRNCSSPGGLGSRKYPNT